MDTDIEEGIETEWEEKMEKTSKKHGEKQEMIREAEEGFGIWTLIDFFNIVLRNYRDGEGKLIVYVYKL